MIYWFELLFVVIMIASVISGAILVIKKKRSERKYVEDVIAPREEMVTITHIGVTMQIRKEEIPMWSRMSEKEKNAMAMHHKELVRKGVIIKRGDGFVPKEELRKINRELHNQ